MLKIKNFYLLYLSIIQTIRPLILLYRRMKKIARFTQSFWNFIRLNKFQRINKGFQIQGHENIFIIFFSTFFLDQRTKILLSSSQKDLKILCFDSSLSKRLKRKNYDVISWLELWTDSQFDIEAHKNTQDKIKEIISKSKKIPKFKLKALLYAELYEEFLLNEKISLFKEKAVFMDKRVIFISSLNIAFDFLPKIQEKFKIYINVGNSLYSINRVTRKVHFPRLFFDMIYYIKKFGVKILEFLYFKLNWIISNNLHNSTSHSENTCLILCGGSIDSTYMKSFFVILEHLRTYSSFTFMTNNLILFIFLRITKINILYIKNFPSSIFPPVKKLIINKSYETFLSYRYEYIRNYLRQLVSNRGYKKILLLPHWSQVGIFSLYAAKSLNIKVMSLPIATVDGNSASIIGWEDIDEIYCYGKQCQQAFLKIGDSTQSLKTVGSILPTPSGLLCQDIPSNTDRRILIATSRIDPEENLWIKKVGAYCKNRKIRLYLRVHPNFLAKDYEDIFNSKDFKVYDGSKEEIYSLLSKCQVCVTDCSSIGAEAIFLRLNLLVVNMTNKPFKTNDYFSLGVAMKAASFREINSCLDRIFEDNKEIQKMRSNYEKFYELYNYKNDGEAVNRLAKHLLVD